MQHKEGGFRSQEREWRGQLNMARAESAKMASRLKAREAALSQVPPISPLYPPSPSLLI